MSNDIKSGFVSVIGRPNAGKSTLLNWLVGEKIAIVSHKANATRKRATIIVMQGDNQIVFLDTPGLHEKERALNQFMLEEALKALGDCELILFLAPVSDSVSHYEKFLELNKKNTPHILLLTKVDEVRNEDVLKKIMEYNKYSDKFVSLMPISVKQNLRDSILNEVVKNLPVHPHYYDSEILTTQNMKEIYKEFIREAIFENTSEELPYHSDVIVGKVEESEEIDRIYANIVVETKSQKSMVIGKNAATLKRIGQCARGLIEELVEKKVFLKLHVVVQKGWSKDRKLLKEFGYE